MKALSLKGFGDISSGDRAAIYQYISRLEGYFLPSTQVTILLNDQEASVTDVIRVELSVVEGGGKITAIGEGPNVIEAVKMASDLILTQFVQIQKAMQKEMTRASEEMQRGSEEVEEPIELLEEPDEDYDLEYKKTNWH